MASFDDPHLTLNLHHSSINDDILLLSVKDENFHTISSTSTSNPTSNSTIELNNQIPPEFQINLHPSNINRNSDRLTDNELITNDRLHNQHLSLNTSSDLSSPQIFKPHLKTPNSIPIQNQSINLENLDHSSDIIISNQSGHPLVKRNQNRLETLSDSQSQPTSTCNPNPPLKKNGKPLAQCRYCGMTFKKLEHCQRHERTHTLARPYPCAVCSKTFARQDTLNRHLRLHSRAEGRVSLNKSSSQSQETQTSVSSPSPIKSPARNLPSSSTSPNSDQLTFSGFSPSPHASARFPPYRQTARERGLSLSAVEHSLFPVHPSRDVSMALNDHCQPINLPPHPSQQHHISTPFQPNGSRSHSLSITPHLSSQPIKSSKMGVDRSPVLPTEVRRGSWCPGARNLNELANFSSSESTPIHSIRNHNHLALQPTLRVDNWEANLTTTFGLVESSIPSVPLSAPATCTKWSALGESGGIDNNFATPSSWSIPTWESLVQMEIPNQNKLNWPTLGRLEEEDQYKSEPEGINRDTSQIILSSPSQPDFLDQPNYLDLNYSIGSSTSTIDATKSETDPSFWCFPSGSTLPCPSSSQFQLSHPVSAPQSEILDICPEDLWNTPQKKADGIFNPTMWHPPACQPYVEDLQARVSSENSFSHLNYM